LVVYLELTDRRGDLGRGEDHCRHLVQQRLKYVVVAAVDQDDLGIGMPQRMRRRDPGKAAAHDHHALALSTARRDNGGCFAGPSLGQYCAHWITLLARCDGDEPQS
jgi:hypothetical protein